jgi:hypothetical protein
MPRQATAPNAAGVAPENIPAQPLVAPSRTTRNPKNTAPVAIIANVVSAGL